MNTPCPLSAERELCHGRRGVMGLIWHANAQADAGSPGQKIPGNQVLMIYRPTSPSACWRRSWMGL
jgi:hypothetical protein